jgi:hypothetical protein
VVTIGPLYDDAVRHSGVQNDAGDQESKILTEDTGTAYLDKRDRSNVSPTLWSCLSVVLK